MHSKVSTIFQKLFQPHECLHEALFSWTKSLIAFTEHFLKICAKLNSTAFTHSSDHIYQPVRAYLKKKYKWLVNEIPLLSLSKYETT